MSDGTTAGGPVTVHLKIRVKADRRAEFDAFLAQATPYYERPGGIKVRLLEDMSDPTSLVEVIEYATEAAYGADQRRIEADQTMKDLLARWRGLLKGDPEVMVYRERGVRG